MALPTNNGKGTERLSAKCILSEPTTKTWGRFDCVFGYDDASSSYRGAPILKNQKVLDIEEGKELKFRMEVVIEPEDDDDEEEYCLMVVVAKGFASELPPMRDHCIINIDWFA